MQVRTEYKIAHQYKVLACLVQARTTEDGKVSR